MLTQHRRPRLSRPLAGVTLWNMACGRETLKLAETGLHSWVSEEQAATHQKTISPAALTVFGLQMPASARLQLSDGMQVDFSLKGQGAVASAQDLEVHEAFVPPSPELRCDKFDKFLRLPEATVSPARSV